jgi:hypothetical protein
MFGSTILTRTNPSNKQPKVFMASQRGFETKGYFRAQFRISLNFESQAKQSVTQGNTYQRAVYFSVGACGFY